MNFDSVNPMPPAFDYRVEEQQGTGWDWKIIVEAVITQADNRETVSFTYTFSLQEFITDGPSSLKDDLFYSFISGGISIATSLSYMYSATMIARDITSSPEYGPGYLLRFMYCLQSRPRPSILEGYLDTGSSSEIENMQLNIATQQSLQTNEINFIPADESAVNSLVVDIYSGDHCRTVRHEGTRCVICLENFDIGAEIVKLECEHMYDRECIVKWLNTSHYCPICKYEYPI